MPAPHQPDAPDQLAAAEAGIAYWRAVAAQRRVDAAAVQKRPLVRAAIALDRRTRALQADVADRLRGAGEAGRRGAVRAGGLAIRGEVPARRAHLATVVEASGAASTEPAGGVVVVALSPDRAARPRVEASDAPVVCLTAPTAEPLHPGWVDALAAALEGGAAAATPQVVHPERPASTATRHDLLVRWEGLAVTVEDGSPRATAARAGAAPSVERPVAPVDLAGPTALALTRATWDRIGGIDETLPPDLALVELSARAALTTRSPVVTAPAALVTDRRPVTSRADLLTPLPADGSGWRTIVERHGPALVRRSQGEGPASFAITTATPSRKVAPRSGDWHFAGGLADALGRAGHRVRCQTIDEADDLAARSCDVHLVLRGLEPVRRTTGQRHVLWVISHPEALDVAECDAADLVLVASRRYAEQLRARTTTPVEVLLQATDPYRFHPVPTDPRHRHRVTVVANTRGFERPAVADAIAAGLDVAVYGTGWDGLIDPALIADEYVAHEDLATVYASADLVLNDHWETMRRAGFVTNRLFDVLAAGTAVASDHLPDIADIFGDVVPTWTGPAELALLVAELRADPAATAARVERGRALVLGAHTFDHRVAELVGHLHRHGLIPPTDDQEPHP